ncbi:hypothetical protein R3P38DRAFT_2747256 [Favolaschia claudopus]|uniref:Reverse transcriptase n=1 Tax=Favolaschia claudopus TaxID=2862362 RepID=A0AAV9ZDR5_9AGAR
MVFGPCQGPGVLDFPTSNLVLGGQPIPWRKEYKYVGVVFNSTTRDIFRSHYKLKHETTAYVFWKTILGCDHYVGRGRLPPEVGRQLYYALLDCHLTHGCDVAIDVDETSFALLNGVNLVILRRILGVGKRSGIPQLYSELGIYPLRVRRVLLALRYLAYLVDQPQSHFAWKSLYEADRLRNAGHSSWYGDIAAVLHELPFAAPTLPPLAGLTSAILDQLQKQLIIAMKQWVIDSVEGMVSIPLLHGRLEPQETGAPKRIPLCQRHYLSAVTVSDHRLALTRLLCGSFYFRGLRSNPEIHPAASLLCRKCSGALETPGHVFLQCRDVQTVAAREVLRDSLMQGFGMTLRTPVSAADAHRLLQELIFDFGTVAPVARFIYKVVRAWRFFGRRLPTMVSELAPDTDDEVDLWDFETATEDGSDLELSGMDMEIDI